MTAFSTRRPRLVLLLCGILLLLRVGGVHLHLCFDGQEAPATLHLVDGAPEHAESGAAGEHRDDNIDDGSSSVAKNSAADFDIPVVLLAAFVLWVVLPVLRISRARGTRLPAFRVPTFLRPPLRGPPVTTFA